ncbi:flippase [Methanococcus maripaludis]|uniref:Putative oligosaccharide transporter n=1 Tax=Methanococcus maripaludis (strain DSM 14266 / JCM 13030 / NBRC 101832 / S2 / LL) TaxID=267377 RepID=Q6M0B7_METMP|nr:flippase [Methanococcus maripaludis]CAF29910.1 putative oligosaccharide transporter [Methanococcus maripaludis S2]
MDLKKKVLLNSSQLFGGQFLHSIISYAIVLMIGRTFGTEGLGQYSFIIAFTAFVAYIADFGIEYYLLREIAKDNQNYDLISKSFGIKVFLGILCWFLIVFLTIFINKDPLVKLAIIIYGLASICSSIGLLFKSIIHANMVSKYESISILTERILTLIVGGVLLYFTKNLFLFMVVLTLDIFILNILRYNYASKYAKIRLKFNLKDGINILKKSYFFWFIYVFSFIYYNTDILMLGIMQSDSSVGIYRGGYFFIQAAMIIPVVVISTVMPSISILHTENRELLKTLFKKAFIFLSFLGISLNLVLFIGSQSFIGLFFGNEFVESILVLQIMSFSIISIFLNSLYGSLLNATGNEKKYAKVLGFSAILNVCLNFLLIPSMSYAGVAVSTLISNWVVTVILMFSCGRVINLKRL